MKRYFQIIAIALAYAILDFVIKGMQIADFNDMPYLLKGFNWHITMFVAFAISISIFAAVTELSNLVGILAWVNEDFLYYVFDSLYYWKFSYNTWFFDSFENYILYICLLNFIILLVINWNLLIKKIEEYVYK